MQLKATGLFSDGSRRDMTAESVWVSSKPDVVRIDSFGRASAVKEGQATVTATANQTSTAATITVGNAALVSTSLAPSPSVVSLGESAQLTAVGKFTDDTSRSLPNGVTWSSSNPEVGDRKFDRDCTAKAHRRCSHLRDHGGTERLNDLAGNSGTPRDLATKK